MRFITDQRVNGRWIRIAILIEVTELLSGPGSYDLLERLGKRTRAGCVMRIETLAGEFAHQVDRKHRLACAWTTVNQKHRLPSFADAVTNSRQNAAKHYLLFVQQYETRLALNDTRDMIKQSFTWSEAALLHACKHRHAIAVL